jgi:hypothetical protein
MNRTYAQLEHVRNQVRQKILKFRKKNPLFKYSQAHNFGGMWQDIIEAAKQGNEPRVTVAPHMVVAELRGLWQRAYCCRSVASTRASRFHLFILAPSYIVLCRSSSTTPPRLAISQTCSTLQTGTPSQPSIQIFAFDRAAVRLHARLFTLAVVALLLGGTGGGRLCRVLTEYATTPFLVGISGVLKNQCGCPPGTQALLPGLGWVLRVPNARGTAD